MRSRRSADLRGGAAKGGAGAVYRDTSEGPWRFAPSPTKAPPRGGGSALARRPSALFRALGEDIIGHRRKSKMRCGSSENFGTSFPSKGAKSENM